MIKKIKFNPYISFQDGEFKHGTKNKKPSPSLQSNEKSKPEKMKTSSSRYTHTSQARTSTAPAPEVERKASARDVFGSDSDDDNFHIPKPGKKTSAPICSYFTKRVPHGVVRQTNVEKEGSHFVELKVYKYDEIKNVQPMNRWRHAIISIKAKSETDTPAWEHLAQYIRATRQEFKDCRPDVISGYSFSYS